MASNELLSTKDLNCEIVPSDIPFDFSDKTRFRKVEFPEQTGVTANSLLQLLPPAIVSDTASKTYILKFPKTTDICSTEHSVPGGPLLHVLLLTYHHSSQILTSARRACILCELRNCFIV